MNISSSKFNHICFILTCILIIFFSQSTNEINDLGYALANWPDFYHKNDIFLMGEKRIKSVIILLAAEMHRNSIDYYLCGYLINLFSNTITIAAVFFLTYIITNNKIISILCSVFLILIYFPNVHNYGVKYINYYIYLGNFAFWLSILIISLHIKKFNKTKNVLLSLLFFTHVYWFFFVILNLFFELYINKKKIIIKNLFFFLLPFLILFFYINNNFLINDFNFNTYFSFKSLDTSTLANSNTIALGIDHNIFFQNKNFFETFNTLIFLLSFNSLFLINTYKNYYSFSKHHQTLCKMFLFSLIGIFIFLLYINVDKNLFFIKFFLGDLALYLHEIYPNRFLNINIVYICIIIFLNLFKTFNDKKNYLNFLILIIILSLFYKLYYNFYLVYRLDILSFLFFFIGVLLIIFKNSQFNLSEVPINKKLIIVIFLFSTINLFFIKKNDDYISNNNNYILKNIEKDSLNLIGPNIYAKNRNHIYKMVNSKLVFPTNNKVIINNKDYLFMCNDRNFYNNKEAYYAAIKECFESRKKKDWLEIKKIMNVTNVIVESDYNLNLHLYSKNEHIKVYKIN